MKKLTIAIYQYYYCKIIKKTNKLMLNIICPCDSITRCAFTYNEKNIYRDHKKYILSVLISH